MLIVSFGQFEDARLACKRQQWCLVLPFRSFFLFFLLFLFWIYCPGNPESPFVFIPVRMDHEIVRIFLETILCIIHSTCPWETMQFEPEIHLVDHSFRLPFLFFSWFNDIFSNKKPASWSLDYRLTIKIHQYWDPVSNLQK